MRKNSVIKVVIALRKVLAVGAAIQLAVLPALFGQAADTTAPKELKPVVVTGSYIPTAETVGVAPLDTVSAGDIQKVGAQDILATLKTLNPAFAGSANVGQTLNNGGYGEAYISLRNLPTLVLIDGKRVNITPFSTYVGTYAADVNMFPLAMIERIEVLKDGASTTYGSDAIGGVVNIITKKDFNGVEVSGRFGFATGDGTYNEDTFSAVVGYAKNGTRLVAGGSYYYSDPLLTKDRTIGSLTSAQLKDAGFGLPPSYYSGSYPGRADSFILAGSPLAAGAPGYNSAINAPPSPGLPSVGGIHYVPGNYTSVAAYNAAMPGVYIPISSTPAYASLDSTAILNTTTLGTISIQRQDRRSAFGNLEQDLFEDHLTVYGQLLYSENENQAKLAPSPIPYLGPYNLYVPADSPLNPFFGTALGQVPNGPQGSDSPQIRSRLIETGNRNFETFSSFWHFVAGLKGDLAEKKYHYDINAAYSQTTARQVQNSASAILLNQAMSPGTGGLSQLGVPMYNIFALPGANDSSTVNAIKASDTQGGFSDLLAIEGIFNADLFALPAGTFKLAAGAQYIHESLNTTAGALLASGNLIGLNAIPPFKGGSREREAGFLEARIPVLSPEHKIPGLYSFEINASGRYETIQSLDTSHDSLVPKVGFRWQPLDEQLTIRGTYSQGFNVPPLSQLYGPDLVSNPYVVTPYGDDGSGAGYDPTLTASQQTVQYLSNPDIPPSTAETMTIGAVYSPKQIKDLTVSIDYYHIEQPSVAFYPAPSAMVADLNQNGANSIYVNNPNLHGTPVYLDQGNNPYVPTAGDPSTYITYANFGTLNLPLLPGGAQRTEGIDLALNYRIDAKKAGTIDLFANANVCLAWEIKLPGGSQWLSYDGQYTDAQAVGAAQGMIPDYNVSAGFTWSIHNFDYTVIAHYLPSVTDMGDMHPSVGAPANDFTANGKAWQVSDYYRIDMQLAYNFRSASGKKWYDGTRLAVGCNNVTDNTPPLIASSSEDNTDKSTYDILGRFIYFEVSKKF